MEQLFAFLIVIFACSFSLITGNPMLFCVLFILGLAYNVIRGAKKNWSIPKEIKDLHKW